MNAPEPGFTDEAATEREAGLTAPYRPPLPAIEHMVSAPNFSTRKAAWDAQARAIVTLIQQYENEHPDDALCLADMVVDIDGQKYCLIGDQR